MVKFERAATILGAIVGISILAVIVLPRVLAFGTPPTPEPPTVNINVGNIAGGNVSANEPPIDTTTPLTMATMSRLHQVQVA